MLFKEASFHIFLSREIDNVNVQNSVPEKTYYLIDGRAVIARHLKEMTSSPVSFRHRPDH